MGSVYYSELYLHSTLFLNEYGILCDCGNDLLMGSIPLPHIHTHTHIGLKIEYSSMIRDIGVRSQVKSYQRLKKGYLMPHCLTLNIIK